MSNTTDPKKTAPKTSVPKPIRPVESQYPEDAELAAWDARMGRKSVPNTPIEGKKGGLDLSGIDQPRLEYLQRQWEKDPNNPKNPTGFHGGGAGRGGDIMTFEQFVTTYYSDFLKHRVS